MTVAELDLGFSPDVGPRVPKLRGYPVVGLLPKIHRDPLRFFVRTVRDYDDVVELDLGPNKALMINNPAYIKHILQDNQPNYHKSKFYDTLAPILGGGIFMAEGQQWQYLRQTATPSFNGCQLKQMIAQMTDATAETLARWQVPARRGEPVNIVPEMMWLTLDIVLRTLLSVRLHGEHRGIYHALATLLRDAERRVWALAAPPRWLPTAQNRRCRAAHRVIDGFVQKIVADRRADDRDHADLLQVLVDTLSDPAMDGLSKTVLYDQVRSFILAGHETTANALSWTWIALSRHPDVARKVKAEVDDVLQGRTPTFEDIKKLTYTKMVFDEALRLYPPVWTMSRTAQADDQVGDLAIPKGTNVMLSPYAVHRHAAYWPNPEGFDPERFTPEAVKSRPRFAYFPFLGGTRNCLGSRFAGLEAVIIMAMVMQRFGLALVPGQDIRPEPMITLRPRGDVFMRLGEAA